MFCLQKYVLQYFSQLLRLQKYVLLTTVCFAYKSMFCNTFLKSIYIMKSIHSKFFFKSLFIALVFCFSLGLTEIITNTYVDTSLYSANYFTILKLIVRVPLIILFSELFLYSYYYYGVRY